MPSLTPPGLIVRNATEADLPAIQQIYAHHVRHSLASFEEVPPDLAELRARRAAVLGHGLPYLSAEQDGTVVGYCYATPYRTRPAYRHTIEDSIYIAPELAGRGIGRALLSALIARCESGPWRQMIAVIGNSGNAGSVGLHRALGFRLVGTFEGVGFKHGQWVNTVLMQRALGDGMDSPPTGFTAGQGAR
ncbi:GCN5 family acetyltransferase [Pandoraea thiooxydans]|uniref:GCN5 family acetyltransferase n=1 Tax=Pandoraea thiooxydans TaxID=445709 RepID=A0A0G3EJI1_9BURK|nr:GNAT family N-acetyltransferase [Pandoraea thiooxydans]AKJ67085.1 GNAT family N-acetyltransferase [Pandoraea thiooxydans]APR94030.1 GCN5 family acetyltransferase [Pandoraea thiooxydans]